MKPVTRLFFITIGWTLAMYSASNFIGAWFWDIGTGLRPILLFYTIFFVVMVLSFGMASRIRSRISSPVLMTLGIVLNAIYLALLLLMQTKTRQYYVPLAVLDGFSSSFYWLSLFVLASSWVEAGQESWYNSWTGTIEAVLGLVAPPLSGWVIQALPGLNGYRTVFLAAFLALLGCTWLALAGRRHLPQSQLHFRPQKTETRTRALVQIPQWRRLVWSFWGLGLRDGIYFFVPSLLLFIVTGSTVLLGVFNAMQAAIEGIVFWALTRSEHLSRQRSMLGATLVSFTALTLMIVPLNAVVLFLLGGVIAVAYPSFKVTLESSALTVITRYGRNEQERTRLTGLKEVWINSGRLLGLVFLVILLSLLGPLHITVFRWILGLWALVPAGLYLLARELPESQAGWE
ncbi:MAG: hypothetical protein M0Z36_01050 [Thermaerobacter sp.]|nr:hypothetical protein [Thermaerobacter sp.]